MSPVDTSERGGRAWRRRAPLVALLAFVFGLSLYANSSFLIRDPARYRFLPPFQAGVDLNDNAHLGAEYYLIARAMVAGRGFADPFGVKTGPTAWMPPVYPLLLAGLIEVFGSDRVSAASYPAILPGDAWVVGAILILKNLVLVLTGWTVLRLASATRLRLPATLALVPYCGWLLLQFWPFFQSTHDTWLIMLCVDLVLLAAMGLAAKTPGRGRIVGWGVLGGLVALTSPAAGMAWLCVNAVVLGLRHRRVRAALGACAVSLAVVSPWIVRNLVVFDEVILVKSNLFFDLYQANYVAPTGVYESTFLARHHPLWTSRGNRRAPYRVLGEKAFIEQHRQLFLENLRAHPEVFARRVLTRLGAATVFYQPLRPELEGEHPVLRSVLFALPAASLLVLLLTRRLFRGGLLLACGTLYAAYLSPYVLAAFYIRYLLPLTPVLVLFVFWGADLAAARWMRPGPSRRAEGSAPSEALPSAER